MQPVENKISKEIIQKQLFEILQKRGIDGKNVKIEIDKPWKRAPYFLYSCCIDQRPPYLLTFSSLLKRMDSGINRENR